MGTAAAAGGWLILQFKPYIANRFAAWRHVWDFYNEAGGYQQTRTMSAIASGGLFGKGTEHAFLKNLGAANTDLVFGVISEEFGLILALLCVFVLLVLSVYAVRRSASARSSYYVIAANSAAAMLIFQASLNVLGAVDILPLTGVTLPFVSVGGSSMIACWGLLAFIKAADTRPNASFTLKLPKRIRGWIPPDNDAIYGGRYDDGYDYDNFDDYNDFDEYDDGYDDYDEDEDVREWQPRSSAPPRRDDTQVWRRDDPRATAREDQWKELSQGALWPKTGEGDWEHTIRFRTDGTGKGGDRS